MFRVTSVQGHGPDSPAHGFIHVYPAGATVAQAESRSYLDRSAINCGSTEPSKRRLSPITSSPCRSVSRRAAGAGFTAEPVGRPVGGNRRHAVRCRHASRPRDSRLAARAGRAPGVPRHRPRLPEARNEPKLRPGAAGSGGEHGDCSSQPGTRIMRTRTNDAGAALISVLLVAGLLAALGVSLVLVGDTERRVAANSVYAVETAAAADAALERALVDLRRMPDWRRWSRETCVESRRRQPAPVARRRRPRFDRCDGQPSGRDQCLGVLAPTAGLAAHASGPISALAQGSAVDSAAYLIVWVADDPADADGNASVDTNGTLTLRAEARGLGGARRAVEATVALTATGALQLISSREVS